MGNGGAAAIPLGQGAEVRGVIGGDALAHGLMLVRSSAMKVTRLHLAMERQDRRMVLETMDDLAALDRRIRDFVEEIPVSDSGIAALQQELEQQKIELARDRLALAAGIIRKGQPPAPVAAEPETVTAPLEAVEVPCEIEQEISEEWMEAREEAPRSRTGLILAIMGMLLMAAAIGALFMTVAGQELLGSALQAAGV